MISAFGVEHGDVEVTKAFSAIGGAIGGGIKSLSKPLGRAANSSKAGFTSPALKQAGKGAKKAGNFLNANKKATGIGAVGAGGVGAAGLGAAMNNKRY